MVSDQELYPHPLMDVQIESFHDTLEPLIPFFLMMPSGSLPDVMEQKRHEKDIDPFHSVYYTMEVFQAFIACCPEMFKISYSHERMFIDSIHMIRFMDN